MPTIEFPSPANQGGQRVTFTHPSQLPIMCPNPTPPYQPIASWATDLAEFQAMCNADNYFDAIRLLRARWMYALTSDVPGGKLAAFKAYVAKTYGPGGPYAHIPRDNVPIHETSGGSGTGAGLPSVLYVADGANWRA